MIIWGTKSKIKILKMLLYAGNCCQQEAGKRVLRKQKWFTLFFIPLIPYSTKYYVECTMCGAVVEVSKKMLVEQKILAQ